MKRKLDPNKIYAFIGRLTVYTTMYFGAIAFGLWAISQITVYR